MNMISLSKNYREAAEAIATKVKDAVLTESEDERSKIITVEGWFQIFDTFEMDMWGGNVRFLFRDNEPQDEEQREARGRLAMSMPQLASLFVAKAGMQVFKKTKIVIETKTRRCIDGRWQAEESTKEENEEWQDCTARFMRLSQGSYGA